MKELKLYISAGIFIALTAVKMLFPQISDEIRDGISEALKMESEQTQAIVALGSSLTKEDIIKADRNHILRRQFRIMQDKSKDAK